MNWDVYSFRTRTYYHALTTRQVQELADAGELEPRDLVRSTSSTHWTTVRRFLALVPADRDRSAAAARADSLDPATDMTPMIDMTFLLLIFFMLTASFHIQKALGLPPVPEKTGRTPTLEQLMREAVVVRIEEDDRILVLAPDADTERAVAPGELIEVLRDASEQRATSTLIIDAADAASHETLVTVLDAGYQAGLEDIRLTVPSQNAQSAPIQRPR